MKQHIVAYVVLVLFGLGVGVGAGMQITKSKVDKSKVIIADLQSGIQESERISQGRIQNANAEVMRLSSELVQVKTELIQVKTELEQVRGVGGIEVEDSSPTEDTDVGITAAAATDNTQTTATTVYTVKEGDSFWKIAASQLGDGNRYKEIMKLNPNVSTNGYLAVGTKLKIPTR